MNYCRIFVDRSAIKAQVRGANNDDIASGIRTWEQRELPNAAELICGTACCTLEPGGVYLQDESAKRCQLPWRPPMPASRVVKGLPLALESKDIS